MLTYPNSGTQGIEETQDSHPHLSPTACGVLTLALDLPYEKHKYVIFMDNLFTSYDLLSALRSYGIGAVGTVRSDRMQGMFEEEILATNNGRLMDWGEIRTQILWFEGGEPVLLIIWQDQAVVRLMSTVHDGLGYMLRNRRRPRDTATMTKATREAFHIPAPEDQIEFLTKKEIQRFFGSRLALPVIIPIDDYNYNMNSVDRADQLRADFNTKQATRRNWLPYFFWLLDSAIINAFLLWRWELESRMNGRQHEGQRSHRQFREFLVEDLIGLEAPASRRNSPIRVYKTSQFKKPQISRYQARHHAIQGHNDRADCYYCRYKVSKEMMERVEIKRTHYSCGECSLPLCKECFKPYHLH